MVANPVMLKMAAWNVWVGPRALAIGLLAVTLLAPAPGCRNNDVAKRATAPDSQKQGRPQVAKLDLTPGTPAGRNRFQDDVLWQRAAGAAASEIDLMRLANREGAAGLLEGLNVGRSVGLTALAALPHAQDGELALSRLCELLAHEHATSLPVLRALHGVVARPPEQHEVLAASGYAGCVPVIERLSQLPDLDPERHDLASSAAGLLLEHRDAGRR